MTKQLLDGWNTTNIADLEIYAEDGIGRRARFLDSDELPAVDGAAIDRELEAYGLRCLWTLAGAGEAKDECVVPVEVIVIQTERGRGIAGVVDGESPRGVETEEDVVARHDLLRKIGYKL